MVKTRDGKIIIKKWRYLIMLISYQLSLGHNLSNFKKLKNLFLNKTLMAIL